MVDSTRRGRILLAIGVLVGSLISLPPSASAATAAGFRDVTVLTGLSAPTAVRFASDGRIFVAEKRGVVKVFSGLTDPTPTVFADLSAQVHDYWDRGMLGMALPPDFPANPYVYVLYTHGAGPGGGTPTWGDGCPEPPAGPGGNTDGCVAAGRLSRLPANGDAMAGAEQVLISDWCQQYPSHTIGDLAFGEDGSLYVTGGEGANFDQADWGQLGGRTTSGQTNPCGDPPSPRGTALTPPTALGGALRSQSLRRPSGPVVLGGTVLRLDPTTGAGRPTNPFAASTDANARRIIGSGLRNPFRFALRPGTSELWVGDVGWSTFEEINRISATGDTVAENFGWPCFEGPGRQSLYEGAGLSLCSSLYSEPGAVTAPRFTYRHDSDAVPGDGCGRGGSTSGMAFNSGTRYPAEYAGALFFADYSRKCIWAMRSGASGPDPSRVSSLVTGASGPVSLTAGPDGYLYYVALEAGEIHRIEYGDATPPPPPPPPSPPAGTQFLSDLPVGSPVNGWGPVERDRSNGEDAAGDGRPLTLDGVSFAKGLGVHATSDVRFTVPAGCTSFTSTVGVDDEVSGGSVGFRVLVNGAQAFASDVRLGTSANLPISVPVTGGAELRLQVTDGADGIAQDHADWADAKLLCTGSEPPPQPPPPPPGNRPPVPVVDTPSASVTWKVGDAISFAGHAVDPEDGALPAARLSWSIVLRHCEGTTANCHAHTVSTPEGRPSGSFTAPTHDYPSYLELQLRATDSAGLTASSSVRLDPLTVDLTFQTNPGGLKLSALGAGTTLTPTPFSRRVIVGSQLGLLAPGTQEVKRTTYVFRSWSNGGAASHTTTAPPTATTYTATYRKG